MILNPKPCRNNCLKDDGTPRMAVRGRKICYQCILTAKRKKAEEKLLSKQKKKVKRTEKRELSTKYLDDLWRDKTKDYYGHKCEYCGKTDSLNSHHVIGRTNKAVRWDYRNCVVLCVYCHKFNRYWSAHETPTLFNDWIRAKRGEEWHTDLIVKARNPITYEQKKFYLEELRKLTSLN